MSRHLYHGYANGDLQAILAEGLDPISYWGDLATAASYAGPGEMLFRLPVERFDEGSLAFNEGMAESLSEEGEDVPVSGTWEESLEAFGSVRYDARLHLSEDDIVTVAQARLDEDAGHSPAPGR